MSIDTECASERNYCARKQSGKHRQTWACDKKPFVGQRGDKIFFEKHLTSISERLQKSAPTSAVWPHAVLNKTRHFTLSPGGIHGDDQCQDKNANMTAVLVRNSVKSIFLSKIKISLLLTGNSLNYFWPASERWLALSLFSML
jgi:hypothetical protein